MAGVIVLKYGGSAMEDSAKVMEILREISLLVQEGFSVVLVHGGGQKGAQGGLGPRVSGDG